MQSEHHDHSEHADAAPAFWKSPAGLALCVVGAVAAYFLLTEHRAHLWGWLPYLLLAACPLMHIFMHHGHDHGQHGQHGPPPGSSSTSDSTEPTP